MNRRLSPPLQLRKTLDDSLLVCHISTPLETCRLDQEASEVRAQMEIRKFDVMGLTDGERITRYVRREELGDGTCDAHGRQIELTEIVSSTTPLIDLLPLMKTAGHLFVLERAKLNSIVTLADLQKSPVRMLLFGLVSLLDMYLLTLVRRSYPDDSYQDALHPKRLDAARRIYEERVKRNEEIDVADCLQICDKRDLILKKVASASLGFKSKAKMEEFLSDAEKLRDRLAHSQGLVLGTSWPAVIDLAIQLDAFLQSFDSDRALLGS